MLILLTSLITVNLFQKAHDDNENGSKKKRTLVLYAYIENVKLYSYSLALKYFIELGVSPDDPADYVFIIQDYMCSVDIPDYPNVKVYRRPNTCFDFGAYGATIEWLGGIEAIQARYDSFIFLNPSALGPILPKYWPREIHWSRIFTSMMKDNIHAVGVTLVCVEKWNSITPYNNRFFFVVIF